MDAKGKAIVAHITLIGWIIALIMNNEEKDEYASFYIRQMLGIMIIGLGVWVISLVPILGWFIWFILNIVLIILWLYSLIYAIQGEMKPIPVLGEQFQEWFNSLQENEKPGSIPSNKSGSR